ncbi:MAG: glycosyltransferase [Chthoniobacterales bacterium]|nr:glycosyltransferase [Chthoniobacterales bacterium]
MLHIYRQITALERFRPVVIAQKREEAERFPFEPLFVVRKPGSHFLRRFWFRNLQDAPWQMSRSEVDQIERILAENDAQLLHIYFGHIAVHLLPLMLHWPRPTVVSFHGADVLVDLDKPRYRAATREMLAAARLVLVRSESLASAVQELGCAKEKIRLHRTGIPLAEIPFQARSWPDDGAWRLLQAGRLIEKKGLKTSLRAFATFRKKNPKSVFTIAGEGPLQEELQSRARELGISDAVRFVGFLSQERLREKFYEAHLFLHPSELGEDGNQEGVPNAMLEAMASGLPVFATNHGGIPEAIESRVSGVLVAERDDAALAEALLDWTSRPGELSQLAGEGARAVAAKFEQSAQVRALEDIYFEALGDRG